MDSILRPVLQPVLQPVLRSVFGASGGGGTTSLTAQVQALFAKYSADGGMYDFTDNSTLFQNSDGTGAVAVGDPIGYVADLSVNGNHLTQPTGTARPVLGLYSTATGLAGATGQRAVHDFTDDHFRYPGAQGAYTVAVLNVSGVQVYEVPALWSAGGFLRPPIAETPGMVLICATLTSGEIAVVTAWLESLSNVRPAEPYYWEGSGASYVARGGTATDPLWTFGDGSTQSSMSGWTETLSPRETIAFEYTALTHFYCNNNQLTGSIPSLSVNTALAYFNCSTNQLTGSIPSLSANTALTHFNCYNNQLTGSIPSLTANTALTHFNCYNNQLTGSIPSLSVNTALAHFYCSTNQLTGSIPSLSVNTALTHFYCNNNQLTGSIPSLSVNTALTHFYCNNNQLTAVDVGFAVPVSLGEFRANSCQLSQAAVDAILAAFVAAGRNSGTRILKLESGNAAPSSAGLADKATLESRGWTVTVTP